MDKKKLKKILNETKAWSNQSDSLVAVQKTGGGLEKDVQTALGWKGGRVVYDRVRGYKVQVDAAYPDVSRPEVVVSVTYTDPDLRGHSNENKLHLKVGELALLKFAHPHIKVILVLGGSQEAWLAYVLKAFEYFFDEVICLWSENGLARLAVIKENHKSVKLKHVDFWEQLNIEWGKIKFYTEADFVIPHSLFRYKTLDDFRSQKPKVFHPSLIKNEVARLCMQRSKDYSGTEWDSYIQDRWHNIEMSRNYFNPMEALIEILLTDSKLKFEGGVARDIPVPSFLHQLGMKGTRVSEDFVLFSKKLNKKVYIQCKSSGGGREQHGKNIQNRTKEQITRSILYRSSVKEGKMYLEDKNFYWISILDGNWSINGREPFKYIHMLQIAGYDKIYGVQDLILEDGLTPKTKNNPLLDHLINDLDCELI
ncbi:MAG TPA: hypothetical protein VHD31_01485 [Candidatus Paceibacterota bacterium]|nr:hypothetical protein [Candidatus Paceibacterota bacterium]